MKTKENKKLVLNKTTIATLNGDEQKNILAGADPLEYSACWENLWTAYHCDMVWTGDQKPKTETEEQQVYQQGIGA